MRTALVLAFGLVLTGLGVGISQRWESAVQTLTITAREHHLGDQTVPDWPVPEPEGLEREWTFEAPAPAYRGPLTLEFVQRDVHRAWGIRLNGEPVGGLRVHTDPVTEYLEIAPGWLRPGANSLAISLTERPTAADANCDDVLVGPLKLHFASFRELFRLRPITVAVRERGSGRALPARLTLVPLSGAQALTTPLHYAHSADASVPEQPTASESTPVRPSIVYCGPEAITFEAPIGDYVLYASRGVEWSRARTEVSIGPDDPGDGAAPPVLELELERQVNTSGWIACDTHLHTYTFSGHGDATTAERVITLAAEGVELAIATDHNHQTDYAPTQERLGLNEWFTPVVGNEVTTRNGHFNAFPLPADGRLPDHTLEDWVALTDDIRAAGAQVVILNHPRWPQVDDCPLAFLDFEPETGRRHRRGAPAFTFDALELVNSTLNVPDPFLLLRDWFGILNGGERVFAVGSSDSHTVGDPVGQGRTYIPSATDDPARIDVDAACSALREGRTSVSMGIVAWSEAIASRERPRNPGMGATVSRTSNELAVRLRVQAPHWVRPREVRVYVNGIERLRQPLEAHPEQPTDVTLDLAVPLPTQHDAYVVCAVSGDGVSEPFWHALNDYTFAATNPIFVDRDGSGAWDSPRASAERVLNAARYDPASIVYRGMDAAVAAQLVALAPADQALASAVAESHPALAAWIARRQSSASSSPK